MKRILIRPGLLILTVVVTSLAPAGENLNGIYLGEDVGSRNSTQQHIAIRITPDGVVTVYKGAVVPGLHDKHGKEVRIRAVRIDTDPRNFVPPPPPPPVGPSSIEEAESAAATLWGVSIPVRGIRYGTTNGMCAGSDGRIAQIALTDYATRVITVNSACPWDLGEESDRLLSAVLAHEFGHLLMGSDHSADKRSVMFPEVTVGQVVTDEDRKRLANWQLGAR